MDHQQRREAGQHLQVLVELAGAQVGELVDPGVEQEALEAEHAGVVQVPQLADVPGDGAAPEADVDVDLALGGLALDLEGGHVDGRRDRVERHVEDGGDPAGGGGPGGRGEALPLGPAGLVDVHVGVDQAGQQDLVVGQGDGPLPGQAGRQRLDGRHPAVADGHAAGHLAGRGDHPGGAQDQVEGAHPPSQSAAIREASARSSGAGSRMLRSGSGSRSDRT